ncbi:hypothetical protein N0V92_007882 [Colletotrichum tropicale]|nr:hypothetical protein N0V92_007882 [Colletotrichum tropicale]
MVWLKKTVLVAAVSLSGIAQAQSTTSSSSESSTSSGLGSSTSSGLESSTLTFTNSSSTLSSSSSSLSSTSGTVSLTSTSTGSESETSTSTGAAPASTSGSVTPSVSVTPAQSSTGGAGASSSAPEASSSAPAASSNAPGASSSAPAASSSAPAASSQAPPASSQAPGASSQAPPASSPAGSSPGGGGAASTPASSGGSTPSSAQSAAASASASSAPAGAIAVLSPTPQAFNNFLDIQPGEAIVSTLTINGQAVNFVIVSQGCRGVPAGQSPFADGTGPESGTAFTPGSCAATCAGKGASMSGAQRGICNCGSTLRTDLPLIAPAQCKASNNAKRQTGTYDPVPIAQAIPASQVAIQQASVTLSQSSLPVVAVNTAPPGASVPASTTAAGSSAGSSAATSGAPGSSAASTGAGASTGAPAGSSAGSSAGASAGASTGASSAGATPASSAGGSPAVSSPAAASATDFILGIVGGRAPSSSVSSSASSSRASSASSSSAASSSASSSRASSSSASSASSASASSASSSSAAASSSPITTVPTSSLSITSPPVSVPSTSTFNFANTTSAQPAQKRAILKRKIEEVAKRQTGAVTYVGRAGSPNPTNCQQASVFRLGASGTLTIDGAAFGVNPGVFFAPLRTGQTGSIVATFTAVTGSGFAWTNPSFFGGQAGFCQDATGQVYATFANPAVAGNVPSGCTTVSFNVIPSSQCAPSGTTLSASSTTPVVSPPVSTPVVNPTTTPVVSPPVSTPVVNPTTTGVAPTGTGATTIVGPSGTTIVGPSGTTIIGPSGTSVVGPSGTDTGATATSSGAVTTVAPNPGTIGDYASLGCFSSGGGFPSFLLVKQDNALTIDSCIAACGGSKLIGVFGTDCYCGSFIDNSQTQQVSENQCNTQCPGNPLQRCGGRSSVAKRQAVPAGVLLSIYIRIDAGSISTVVSVSVSAGIDTTASFTFTTVVTDPGVTVTAGVPSQTPNVVGTLTLPPGLYTEGQPTPTGEFCRITTGSWYIGSTTLLPFPLPTA